MFRSHATQSRADHCKMCEATSRSLLPRHIEAALIAGAKAATPAASLVDQLTPPVGTSFFIKKEFTIIEQQELSWYVTAHVYITGANPLQSDFEGKGGQIHLVLVHSGRGVSMSIFQSLRLHVTVEANPRPEIQLPPTGSGEVQYNNKGEETGYTRFTIHFQRLMAMLRNNGMEPFSFNAAFEQVYDRYLGSQTGTVSPDGKGVNFEIIALTTGGNNVSEIYGLSTFRTSKLIQSIVFTCKYDMLSAPSLSGSKLCTISLSFT